MEKTKTKPCSFSFNFLSWLLKITFKKLWKCIHECCYFVPSSLYQSMCGKKKYWTLTNHFLFFTGKSESTWHCPGELTFKAKKNRNKKQWVNTDGTNKLMKHADENIWPFSVFSSQLTSTVQFPFNKIYHNNKENTHFISLTMKAAQRIASTEKDKCKFCMQLS